LPIVSHLADGDCTSIPDYHQCKPPRGIAAIPRRQTRKKPSVVHTSVAILVDGYEARISASVNYSIEDPRYSIWELRPEERVFEFVTHLTITGTVTQPAELAGHRYEFTIYGNDGPSRDVNLTLKDVQVRDEKYNSPQYREYRGRRIPVVRHIPGLATVDKERGAPTHRAWLNIAPRMVSDMLVLLASGRKTYVDLQESREARHRWIRRFEVQTTDPSNE
jgi:hypothetical protein